MWRWTIKSDTWGRDGSVTWVLAIPSSVLSLLRDRTSHWDMITSKNGQLPLYVLFAICALPISLGHNSSVALSTQHLKHLLISKSSIQFLHMLLSRNPLFCRLASMRWRRRKVQLHTLWMLSFRIMSMDTNPCLLHHWLNLKSLRLLWYSRIALKALKWISRGSVWYTIYRLPSRLIFMRAPSPEHTPSLKSTVPTWRRWVSSSVRLLTWSAQLVVGYHARTKYSSLSAFIILFYTCSVSTSFSTHSFAPIVVF